MVIKQNLLIDTFNLTGVRKFDRRKESLNKLKYRSKVPGFHSATVHNMGGKNKQYQNYNQFAGSIPNVQSNSTDIYTPNFTINPQVSSLVESIVDAFPDLYEHGELLETIQHCA